LTKRVAGIVAALVVLHLILIQPNHPGAMTWAALRLIPLELPVILLALVAAPAALLLPLRVALTVFLTLMPLVKVADYAAFVSYARGFNLVLDAHLLPAAWNLTSGAIGVLPALGAVVGMLVATAVLALVVWWATGRIASIALPAPGRVAAGVALVAAAAIAVSDMERWWRPFHPGAAAFTARLAVEHSRAVAETRTDLARFREEAARDAFAAVPREDLLAGLDGTDVMIVFVESYGRSTLDNPRYAPTIRPRLEAIEEVLDASGLAIRSGWMTAPMVGGQSWLAHASILSGLWIDNQRRYQALLTSPRRTLMHYGADAGFRTTVVAPAITLAWPESRYFGYEAIYPAAALGYEGEPFNWVTMPDQFTLKAFERLELARTDRPPLMAEIALISSHAPWTPVPELVDWDEIGNGTIFNEMALSGDPPEVVWRDRDRVRDQFRQAVDYSLEVVGSFAQRHAENPPLMIVLGDHEPATFVAEIDSFDVPVHVIGPPEIVARVEHWGFTPGMTPDADAPVWQMSEFRDRFLAAFTPDVREGVGDPKEAQAR
jgi:hypothetical protein